MASSEVTKLAGSAVVASLLVIAATTGLRWWKRRKEEFRHVGKISRLFIFPIKSCRGIEVQAFDCTHFGPSNNLARDRTFVIVNREGTTVTARQVPKLVLLTPSFHDAEMWLDAAGMETFKLKVIHDQETRPIVKCIVCRSPIEGRDCGAEVGEWIDKYIGSPGHKLVQFTNDLKPRLVGIEQPFPRTTKHDVSTFTDLSTYNVLPQASLDDLNSRLANPVPMEQFRPNMVVEQSGAFEEDHWVDIRVGEHVQFRNIMPCNRCVLTLVNPNTGVKDDIEPLKTLRSYRQTKDPFWRKFIKDTPMLGLYLSIDRCGRINVGDPVYATIGKV